jgi:branched-chain amino acid transport system ATP-binding protein
LSTVLQIRDLVVSYGKVRAVNGVSLDLGAGELGVILGANGAGKTTIIKTVMGLLRANQGSIRFEGQELVGMRPHAIHRLGIAWVPEGRQLWHTMTVLDNLLMGAFEVRDKAVVARRIEEMFVRFPRLKERQRQLAGSLSGGEQQMVAIARALISGPKLLLMDEPSLGLAPIVIRDVFALTREINAMGIAVLMAEQNARQSLKVAHTVHLLELGDLIETGPAAEIAAKESIQDVFLGGRA